MMEQDGLGIASALRCQREIAGRATIPPVGVGDGEQVANRAVERTPVGIRRLDRVEEYSVGGAKPAGSGGLAPQKIEHPARRRPPVRDELTWIAVGQEPRMPLAEVARRGTITMPAADRIKPPAVAAEFVSEAKAENFLEGHEKR